MDINWLIANPMSGVTLLVFVMLLVNELVFRLFAGRVSHWLDRNLRDLVWQNFHFLSATSVRGAVLSVFHLLRWLGRLLFLVLFVSLLGLHSSHTNELSMRALHWLAQRILNLGQALWAYMPNLLTIVFSLLFGRALLKVNSTLFAAVKRSEVSLPGFDRRWSDPTRQIIAALTILVTLATVLPLLPGAASPVFRGASVLVGVLLSLGSGAAMTNLVSGLSLTYSNAFQVEDVVKIGEFSGHVVERTLLVTRLRTFKNEEVTLPNSTVMNGNVVNYSNAARDGMLIFHTTVCLGYDVAPGKVAETLLKAAQRCDGWCASPPGFVLQSGLEGSWVSYELNVYVDKPENTLQIYSALRREILQEFNQAGIELMTPTMHALRDANASTVPCEFWPEGYEAPGFRLIRSSRE